MPATGEDISRWFDDGLEQGATHMVVVCDTFEWEDFPVYVKEDEDVREVAEAHDGPNMTKLMEVYSLRLDKESQLVEWRAFHYD